MKCLKFFLLVLSLLAVSLGSPLVAKTMTQKVQTVQSPQSKTQETIYLSENVNTLKDTIIIEPCVFDTIRLAGKGHKYKGKRYYYTDKECYVVELKAKNKKAFPLDWLVTIIKKVLNV